MSNQALQAFLKGLRGALGQAALYPPQHPKYAQAIAQGLEAAGFITAGKEGVTISIRNGVCYLNGTLSAHTSLIYANMLEAIAERGIESITLHGEIEEPDYRQLVRFIAAQSEEAPKGTIQLNEVRNEDLETSISALQTSYIGTVGSLRRANQRLAGTGSIELGPVMGAVDMLIDQSLSASSAALLLSTVSSHDEYTFYHSVNTCLMAVALGQLIGLDREELVAIGAGAVLHDVGKVAISRNTLNHPGRLNTEQWQEVALHPQEGAQAILIAGGPGHEVAAAIALEHHARFDGMGYPHMASMQRPHLFSRLVSVVDVYDALTTRRPYRRSQTPHRALQLLLHGAGTAFDPDMVKLFIEMVGIFPPGSVLLLADGTTVVVSRQTGDLSDIRGILVRDAAGQDISPEPLSFAADEIAEQLTADVAGIDPASLLNEAGIAEAFTPPPASRREASVGVGMDERAIAAEASESLSGIAHADDEAA